MTLDETGKNFIVSAEGGFVLSSYKDTAGVYTIGAGSIFNLDKSRVREGQNITIDEAEEMFNRDIENIVNFVNASVKTTLTQNQFNACVSLAYNEGIHAFQTSTLLRKINVNANDPTIIQAFLMWDKDMEKGKLVENEGLHNRRNKEIALYFNYKIPNLVA